MSTQTISDFPAGNYTFQYEWSAFGGSQKSCSNIRIQPFHWRAPPFDWTTTTVEYFSEVPFKIGTIQTCWGYGGEIRLRTLKWMRKKGTWSLHLLISHQENITKVELMLVQSIYLNQGQYTHHAGAAVPGNNIKRFENRSVLECKELCNADQNCLAFDYATARDAGSYTTYPTGTCILQSSNTYTDHSSSNGYKNLDCYVKTGSVM